MRSRLTPCTDCGYGLRADADACPNCGLVLKTEESGSLLDRLWGRKTEPQVQRKAECLQTLEAHLNQEVARLQETLDRLDQTRGPLQARRMEAASKGRSTRALDEGLAQMEHAAQEARLLLERHKGLLEGISLDRRHNRLLLEMHEERGPAPDLPPPSSLTVPLQHIAPHPGTSEVIGLSADGRTLYRIGPQSERKLALPGISGKARLLVRGDWLLVAQGDTLRALHLPTQQPSEPLTLSRGQIVAMDLAGNTLLLGSDQGKLSRHVLRPGGKARFREEIVAHPFGMGDVALTAGGKRALSCGGGWVTAWWVTDTGLVEFHKGSLPDARQLLVDEPGGRVAVLGKGQVSFWDLGLTAQQSALRVPADVEQIQWAPDGVRLLLFGPSGIRLGATSGQARPPLSLPVSGRVLAAGCVGTDLVVCAGNAVFDTLQLQRVPLEQTGPTGASLVEIASLQATVRECRRWVPADVVARAKADPVLLEQARNFVATAGRHSISRIVQRAAGAELLDPVARIQAFELLFGELEDLIAGLRPAEALAGQLGPDLRRLQRLPTAVLLGQVDALLAELEGVLACESSEEALDQALETLSGLERWLAELDRLAKGLKGSLASVDNRPQLVASINHLAQELPEVADVLHARLAAVVVGRVDKLGGEHALEKLRDQRRKVQGVGGLGAQSELEDRTGDGAVDAAAAAEQRSESLDRLGQARRELGAETEAFLEVQGS